jgi:nicotinamide-nucleotide amidase
MKNVRSAEILCVGTELLLGDIINTNASYISRRLAALGIPVYRQAVVGDNPERMRQAIAESFSRSDCLILSGGLGPTCDDITKEMVAECLGLELELNEEALERMKAYFSSTGRNMTKNNESRRWRREVRAFCKTIGARRPDSSSSRATRRQFCSPDRPSSSSRCGARG